jgi:acyl-CoA thioester hydrolase
MQVSQTDTETRLRVPLRRRDVDELGHLNQAVYHELLEEGRAALFAPVREDDAFNFALVRIELDYRREVRLADGAVEVVARVAAIGRTSVTVTHEIVLGDGTVAAEGRSVLVAWDRSRRRSRELTERERARLGALPSGDQ